jgi:DNA (cytosine-5)-methyltransferase 1
MRVLNLYAGLGGNRKLWRDVEVIAVEACPKIAEVYQALNLDDLVIQRDAHAHLLAHYSDFDFIWSSPPCQSHGRMVKASRHKPKGFPDLKLYEEIIFLKHFFKGKWVVENVTPYYEPLIPPTARIGRHLFWANFPIVATDVPRPANFINRCNIAGMKAMQDWLGIHYEGSIYYGDNHCPAQVLRNCVHPLVGEQILNCARASLSAPPASTTG